MQLLFVMLKTLFELYAKPVPAPKQTRQTENHQATTVYEQKKRIVKTVWIFAGLLMLFFPAVPVVMLITLTTTFISFVILDETDYDSEHHD
ncbi:hypothetical protein ACWJJH_21010 [Endozoicomonadaceae bacterium StTr2]